MLLFHFISGQDFLSLPAVGLSGKSQLQDPIDFFSDFQDLQADDADAGFGQQAGHVGQSTNLVGNIDEEIVVAWRCPDLVWAQLVPADFGLLEKGIKGSLIPGFYFPGHFFKLCLKFSQLL